MYTKVYAIRFAGYIYLQHLYFEHSYIDTYCLPKISNIFKSGFNNEIFLTYLMVTTVSILIDLIQSLLTWIHR